MRRWPCVVVALAAVLAVGCSAGGEQTPDDPAPVAEDRAEPEPPGDPASPAPDKEDRQDGRERETVRLLLYRVEDLMGGAHEPHRTLSLPIDSLMGITFSRQGDAVLLFPTVWTPQPGADLYRVDLASGALTALPGPDPHGFWYAGWLPDGRLLVVGRKVWIGTAGGGPWEAMAEVGAPWTVVPSPSWRALALWGHTREGLYTVVDLEAGQADRRVGPFRRCAQDGGVNLAWSPDGKHLAGTDCDSDVSGQGERIRTVDPFSGEQVRTVEGCSLVGWLPDGLLGWCRRPEGGRKLVLIGEDGSERELAAGYARPSPDGRYLIRQARRDGRQVYVLMDLRSGEQVPLDLPGTPLWAEHGDIYVLE